MCNFLQYSDEQMLEILNGVTGWDVDAEEAQTVAHRGQTLARLFNVRQGFTREDDVLPVRFQEALPMHEGMSPEFQNEMVESYYAEQGWNAEGVPTAETLAALGIPEDSVALTS